MQGGSARHTARRGRLSERGAQQLDVGGPVHHEQRALEPPVLGELAQLVQAAAVRVREAAQVHQDDLASQQQRLERSLPGVVVAQELVDAEAAVRVARFVEVGQPSLQVRLVAHELVAQAAPHESDDVARVEGTAGDVGAADHLDAARQPPALSDGVEESLGAAPEAEHS